MALVGRSVPRSDGPAKVAGTARYVDDLTRPGVLFGGTLRSPVARGRLNGIRRDPAFDWAGVTIVTAEDVPVNVVALIEEDQPVLASDEVRHAYEPIALVAAEDPVRLARDRPPQRLDSLLDVPARYRTFLEFQSDVLDPGSGPADLQV